MYAFLFRHFLARLNPESAHHLAFFVIGLLPVTGIGLIAQRATRPADSLRVKTMGLEFPSPFGLAAGPDKDGKSLRGLAQLGFGHVEVGTLTARPQEGNPRPRLFRLIKDRALINRMGFNNQGSASAVRRLERFYSRKNRPLIAANIGKSRVVELAEATDDYLASVRLLRHCVDYFVVNVSSPNTPGLRDLQSSKYLIPLMRAIKDEAQRPVLLKIAPDLGNDDIRRIARDVVTTGLAGIVAVNTTTSRSGLTSDSETVELAGQGGLSGRPLAERSIEVLRIVRESVPSDFCVVSVGGVTTADDVRNRLQLGATLVQGYTGFLYTGPLWARKINRGLAAGPIPVRESAALRVRAARA